MGIVLDIIIGVISGIFSGMIVSLYFEERNKLERIRTDFYYERQEYNRYLELIRIVIQAIIKSNKNINITDIRMALNDRPQTRTLNKKYLDSNSLNKLKIIRDKLNNLETLVWDLENKKEIDKNIIIKLHEYNKDFLQGRFDILNMKLKPPYGVNKKEDESNKETRSSNDT